MEEFLAMENPFALIVLTARKALLEGKVPEEQLNAERTLIALALITAVLALILSYSAWIPIKRMKYFSFH